MDAPMRPSFARGQMDNQSFKEWAMIGLLTLALKSTAMQRNYMQRLTRTCCSTSSPFGRRTIVKRMREIGGDTRNLEADFGALWLAFRE